VDKLDGLIGISLKEAVGCQESSVGARDVVGWELESSEGPRHIHEGPGNMTSSFNGESFGDASEASNRGWGLERTDEVVAAVGDRKTCAGVPDDGKGARVGWVIKVIPTRANCCAKGDSRGLKMIREISVGDVRRDESWSEGASLRVGHPGARRAGAKLLKARAATTAVVVAKTIGLLIVGFGSHGTWKGSPWLGLMISSTMVDFAAAAA
jgi:hypothetical protein